MVYCVYSLELPRLGDSNENKQHTFSYRKSKIYPYNALRPGTMINTPLLELPLSRTYFHRSKGARHLKVLLLVLSLRHEFHNIFPPKKQTIYMSYNPFAVIME